MFSKHTMQIIITGSLLFLTFTGCKTEKRHLNAGGDYQPDDLLTDDRAGQVTFTSCSAGGDVSIVGDCSTIGHTIICYVVNKSHTANAIVVSSNCSAFNEFDAIGEAFGIISQGQQYGWSCFDNNTGNGLDGAMWDTNPPTCSA